MRIALIGGTGTGDLFAGDPWSEATTPYGPAYLARSLVGGREIVLLRRHGPEMRTPPHLINHHANIWALRENGVRRVLATAAVGSLRPSIGPATLALLEDFIDFSKRGAITVFDRPEAGLVHTDFSRPYCPELSHALRNAADEMLIGSMPGVTYVGVDGPRYESPAEVRMFAQLGGDVVGMTAVPETILARELGMCYACLAIVTNYGTGISDRPLAHEDVVRLVNELKNGIRDVLEAAVRAIPEEPACGCAGDSDG